MGSVLLALLLGASLFGMALLLRDLLTGRARGPLLVAGISAALICLAGLAVIVTPITASTSARCSVWPATDVVGPDGSWQQVRDASNPSDAASTASCIRRARLRAGVGGLMVIGSVVGYAMVRRRKGWSDS